MDTTERMMHGATSTQMRISQTTDLTTYIKRQQRAFVCNIVRKDNTSIVERLMFNSDASHRPGPQTTLLSSDLK